MWITFNVFIQFVTLLLLFFGSFFGQKACGLLVPQPGLESTPPALEGEVLIMDLQGSPSSFPL